MEQDHNSPEPAEVRHEVPAEPEWEPYFKDFWVETIQKDDEIKLSYNPSGGYELWVKCDWENIDPELSKVNAESLTAGFEAAGRLEKELPNLTEEERRLVYVCFLATAKVRQLFGEPAESEAERNLSFSGYETAPNTFVKPLSKAAGQSMCGEYATLAKHILDKAGIPSVLVNGIAINHPDPAELHSYLVVADGEYVFDPTLGVRGENDWPWVFKPEAHIDRASLRATGIVKAKDVVRGVERTYGIA